MQEIKIISIIIIVFAIAFATAQLLNASFVCGNYIAHGLVILLTALELLIGYFIVKIEVQKLNK